MIMQQEHLLSCVFEVLVVEVRYIGTGKSFPISTLLSVASPFDFYQGISKGCNHILVETKKKKKKRKKEKKK